MKDSEILRHLARLIGQTIGTKALAREIACLEHVADQLDGVKPCEQCNGTGHVGWAEGQILPVEGEASAWCETCRGRGRVKLPTFTP